MKTIGVTLLDMSAPEVIFIFFVLPLLLVAGAISLWTLTLLARRESWLAFVLVIPVAPLAGAWLLARERPRPCFDDIVRLGTAGGVIVLTLFFPFWVTGVVVSIFLAMEISVASGPLYPRSKLSRSL